MLTIRPRRALGVATGSVLFLLLGSGFAFILARITSEPPSFTSFFAGAVAALLLVLAGCIAYWTYGCWSLRYLLDRNALTIAWAGNTYEVPLKEITGLVPPGAAPEAPSPGGVWWPGYRVGRASLTGGRLPKVVLFFTAGTTGRDVTYVVTPARGYAISPPEPEVFAEELRLRARLGPLEEPLQEVHRWTPWDLAAWEDRRLQALVAVGLLANLALFGYQALLMPGLPEVVPLHLSSLGLVDRVGPKVELFGLPAAGLALLIVNTVLGGWVYRVERVAGYLIVAWAAGTQALLWGAWIKLLG